MKEYFRKMILACLIVIACIQLCGCHFSFWNLEGTQIAELGKLKKQQENGVQNAAETIGTTLLYQGISKSYSEINDKIREIEADYLDESGYVAVEDADSLLEAVYQDVKEKVDGTILTECSYAPGDSCVYMQFAGWIGVIYEPEFEDALCGGEEVNIYTFQPYSYQRFRNLFAGVSGLKTVDEAADLLIGQFDDFTFAGNYDSLEAANLQNLLDLPAHSIILWDGHGGYREATGSYLGIADTGHNYDLFDLTDEAFKQMVEVLGPYLQDDSVFLTESGHYVVTSRFFDNYLDDDALSGSLIYLNACHSLEEVTNEDGSKETDQRLARSLMDKGAACVVGNSGTVLMAYCMSMEYSFCEGLTKKTESGKYLSIAEALIYAQEKQGGRDPRYDSYVSIMYCDDSALDLTMKNFSLYGTAEGVLLLELDKLVTEHGMFRSPQTGSMTSWQDAWFAPGGIMGAAIEDFDGDEEPEMLVCISEQDDSYTQDGAYHIMLYLWECKDRRAEQADCVPYGAYIQSEYREGNVSEVHFTASNWSEEILAIHTVKVDDHCYLFCEDHELASAFADGSGRSYWLMSYQDGKLEYNASFTQTEGGSSDFAYTGYCFDHGALSSSDLYYKWYDNNALYQDYGKALSAFWENEGITIDDHGDFTSILSSENEAEPVFIFNNTLVSQTYSGHSTKAVFEADLTWGNCLLEAYEQNGENGAGGR
ncbi:MAG: hypothetical protein LUD07_03950 [Clostridiales bacterium]|nr:hypothetical protein [Clostridiales bacterium]